MTRHGATPGELHLWVGRASGTVEAGDLALLDERELRRLEGFHDERQRARYAGARAAIRRTVGRRLGVLPAEVGWGTEVCPGCGSERHGPPSIRRPPTGWRVSVSRSEEWWMLGLSYGLPVGVDIERRRAHEVPAVVRRCLDDGERAYVAAREGARRDEALMRCWVRKEAVVKAWGVGLGTDLARVAVRPAEERAVVPRMTERGPEWWEVREVSAVDECLTAFARPAGAPGPVVLHAPTGTGTGTATGPGPGSATTPARIP
ncbi:4'-phosphopantetheinyl transferase family protein [Streptomyces goshikiensis]|uniref:4'-phosphopantetheinyl transferase family protein n=1 Tax=Streptomyces goshikiensis TaxID=1942 RepID=UPI0036BB5175